MHVFILIITYWVITYPLGTVLILCVNDNWVIMTLIVLVDENESKTSNYVMMYVERLLTLVKEIIYEFSGLLVEEEADPPSMNITVTWVYTFLILKHI